MRGRILGLAVILAAVAAAVVVLRRPEGPAPAHLYASGEESGTLTIIDIGAGKVEATIPVGKRPRGVQVSPNGKTVYVALSGSVNMGPGVAKHEDEEATADKSADGIGVVDVASKTLTKMLVSGSDPEQFAISADAKRLYIANEDTAALSVVDIANNAIVKTVSIGSEPEGVALLPDGSLALVASETGNRIDLVDTASNTLAGSIPVGARPRAIAVSHDGARAVVTLEDAGSVVLLDLVHRSVLKTVKLLGDHVRPMGVALSPEGRTAYVTTGRGKKLFALDAETLGENWSLDVGDRPWGVAVSRDGRQVFTANGPSNDVSVVDVESQKVVARIPVPGKPWGLAIGP